MSHDIRIIASIVLVLVTINSCSSQSKNHSTECIGLNNEGIKYLTNYPMNGEKGLDKAIDLFKQAVNCDSTNVNFYNSLANAYDKKHNYDAEMVAMNKMLLLTLNDPGILVQKGMLFEVMGHVDSAKEIYSRTDAEYQKRLAKRPNDINLIEGMILLKAITDGKDEAIKVINKQIETHPDLSSELSHELLFYQYFNRHDYVFRSSTGTDLNKAEKGEN